ncbi:alpha/beta fold hydrolase [Neptunicella marina]|uniref:Alpha/beta fold hydrolase n=1 Tax=Neptunicella marina TaxID=2125989 RepID=A0A8J6IR64_9ALTE|nr:alpha/beta fold hydrolase [Neptunicella marina]MBC3764340.1 alpha/beta fold hydrolase [Neptunicella marina]
MNFLNYKITGSGQSLVLIHGLFGSLENLGMIARELQDKYQIISIDLPDHGQSFRTENFSYDTYASAVMQTLDHIGIQRTTILGHSMGGKVAMNIALTQPDLIEKLIIADIAPVKYGSHHTKVFAGLNAVNLQHINNRNEADQMMQTHIKELGVRQFLLKSLYTDNGTFAWRFNLPLLQRDYDRISAEIDADQPFTGDVLFIKGANSDYIRAEYRSAIEKLFPNARAQIMQDCGHWLHAEKPQQFSRIVDKFIQS